MSLPLTFGILMATAVLLGVYASWQSLRAVFRAGHIRDLPSIDVSEARRALEDEKAAVLGNIRDLRFEHEAGKIADDDFEWQDERLRARAREVLRLLDEDLDTFTRRAEQIIVDSLGPGARSPYRAAVKESEPSKGSKKSEPSEEAHTVPCPSCQKENGADAEFCKKCGASMAKRDCASCGTTNDPDAEFCKKCGKKIAEAAALEEDATVSEEGDAPAERADDATSPDEEASGDDGAGDDGAGDDDSADDEADEDRS